MKKISLLVLAAVMAVSAVKAEALLTEHFNQSSETLATNDNVMGDALESDWTNVTGSGNIYMNDLDLIYAGYKSATDGTKSIEYKATFGKKVAKPFKAKSSGSIFSAAIINVTSCGSTSTGRDYLWALSSVNTGGVGTAGNHFGRLCVEKGTDSFKFGIAKVNESTVYISYTEDLEYGQYLVVVEYEFVSGDNNDVVRLYLNPVKGDKPAATLECQQSFINPNTGSDVGSGTKADPAQLQAFVLSNTSSSNKWACLIDELKVATNWSDLWEADPAGDPTIIAESEVAFGSVATGEPVAKKIVIKGTDLKGNINVVSNNAALVPSASVISKDKAASKEGFELTLTLTPTAGEGSAKVTLSSEDADSKEISVAWFGMSTVENIAALKACSEFEPFILLSEPIVTNFIDGIAIIQDASGALPMDDQLGVFGDYGNLKIGDQLSNLILAMMDAEGNVHNDFAASTLFGVPQIKSHNNELVALKASLDDISAFGPAFISVEEVLFTDLDKEVFAEGHFNISKGESAGRIKVPAGCDLIDEAIPAKADVQGNLIWASGTIEIRSKADLSNQVAREATGVESIQHSDVSIQKFILDGQLIILREGKTYNAQGAEL